MVLIDDNATIIQITDMAKKQVGFPVGHDPCTLEKLKNSMFTNLVPEPGIK